METTHLSNAASSILWWKDAYVTIPFPREDVELEITFCKGNIPHRLIAVNAIALECLPFCSKEEMEVIDQKLKEIAAKN